MAKRTTAIIVDGTFGEDQILADIFTYLGGYFHTSQEGIDEDPYANEPTQSAFVLELKLTKQ